MNISPPASLFFDSATALLIIDMQEVYFESSELHARRSDLVAACNQLLSISQRAGSYSVIVQTQHERDTSTWTLSMLDDEKGYLFADDTSTSLVGGLHADKISHLTKTRDSAFFATDLANRLHARKIEQLIIAGISTHTCVAQTAADAYAHNFRVSLAGDAIASHRPEYHDNALTLLRNEYRQEVYSNQDLIRGVE